MTTSEILVLFNLLGRKLTPVVTREALFNLTKNGLICEKNDRSIQITEKGRVMVEHLCQQALPTAKWVCK